MLDVVDEVEAVDLAVLGRVGEAVRDRLADGRGIGLLAVQENLAGDVGAIGPAEDAHGEFGAPRSHQAGDADHLALAHADVDALDDLPIGVKRVMDDPVLYLEQHLADIGLA